ncbi:MAG: phenolic acid decarboxylase [Candidatus Tokpelaia sp.]|uniref:phenolic acid decarboxylase n=1 Tax=Candidatus Tokpelaia sp. TaxID=2233777 RepID=UPI00123A83EB|nr:phenolic acid decarboxylase [Candidatus Tokpelaia sp.]KAA6204744.1 MAG: phenolic acid decarboxylase [Candidatus Tokpelaia sp.]KAA6206140.1 MAG: phenolic acid decarboxylase [Candidatus Tokpelaia sp.]KAA6405758.1 phenolic acid decarboxylase [Candidatus Tokpelaia sp.]
MDKHKESGHVQNSAGLVGRHFFHIYANGWQYEAYIKNRNIIDYRVHSGIAAGRFVRNQPVYLALLAENMFHLSWVEPTGTMVCQFINLDVRKIHSFACFPRWVKEQPQKTICFQNDHLDLMQSYREAGPTYPHFILNEWANIVFVEDCGLDDETIIDCPPAALPPAYADRRN